jgi:hypothetical protein
VVADPGLVAERQLGSLAAAGLGDQLDALEVARGVVPATAEVVGLARAGSWANAQNAVITSWLWIWSRTCFPW